MRKMKDSGIEWIGDIPENWNVGKTLFALSMPITDGPHETPELLKEGIPFVSAEAVSCGNGKIDFEHIRGFISQEYYEECCKKYTPQINDIYMIKSGATTGKVALVDTDEIFTIWSPLAVFRCDDKKCFYKYLFYVLQSDYYQKQVENKWSFGTQQNIGMRTLEKLLICYPPVKEQVKIANYLDNKCVEIDALIEAKEKTNALLKEQRQSIIYEAVTKGLNPDVPMKDSGIEWIGEIPESWEVCKIKHFAEGEDGVKIGPFGSALTNRLINDGDYNVYSQANLIGADFSKTNHTINEETFTQLNNYEVLPGDICVSMMGTIGKCKVVPDGIKPGIMDSHLIKIRLDSTVNPKFFEYVYDKDNSGVCFVQMKMESKGSIMDGLNSKIVKNLLFPLPPIEEQDFIVKYLEEKCGKYDSLIKANNTTIDSLKEYRKSIIFEAVTGKVEI